MAEEGNEVSGQNTKLYHARRKSNPSSELYEEYGALNRKQQKYFFFTPSHSASHTTHIPQNLSVNPKYDFVNGRADEPSSQKFSDVAIFWGPVRVPI